jgi:AcrR family transcriptional regulator
MASTNIATNRCSAEDRRRQILEAATGLFASQGFKGTTTRQIADLAKVNEAIIFRHFSTKEDLYWAVLEHKCRQGGERQIIAEYLAGDAPPVETFAGLARAFLRFRLEDPSLGRLLLFSALEHHQLSERFFRTHIADLYEVTAQYIRKQIRAGQFRSVDPLMAARGFWGMVVYHFLIQELFGAKHYQDFELGEASHAIADIWLHGMLPGREARPARRSQPAGTAKKP